jgi:DNA-binding MarR family transcriptional regulator
VTEPLSKRRLKLWIRMLRVTRLAEAELREFLRVEHQSTLPRFDVMAALHRANDALTMSELSRMLLVSNGNTTTVVDRLEKDGLVARTPSSADRRIVHVALTDDGRRHFEQLAEDHEARVDELFAGVSATDLDALTELLQHMGPSAQRTSRTTRTTAHDIDG